MSHCGWPSFDECIDQAVKSQIDPDGMRTEIQCAQYHAHLGHVFSGENFTKQVSRRTILKNFDLYLSFLFLVDLKGSLSSALACLSICSSRLRANSELNLA